MSADSPQRIAIFLYGTLMRGFCRHHHLEGQEFIAEVRTRPLYRMVNCGSYPGLLRAEAGNSIEGELWAVDADGLERLDEVEGVADGLYSREPVSLAPPYDREQAQAYFFRQFDENYPDCGTRWV